MSVNVGRATARILLSEVEGLHRYVRMYNKQIDMKMVLENRDNLTVQSKLE